MTTILAIDPGGQAGHSLIVDGDVETSGEFSTDTLIAVTRIEGVVHAAAERGAIMVIEDFRSRFPRVSHRAGVRAGYWIWEARRHGMIFHWTDPNDWHRGMFQATRPSDEMKRLAVDRASREVPHEPRHNEADAICMGLWCAHELRNGRVPWEGK